MGKSAPGEDEIYVMIKHLSETSSLSAGRRHLEFPTGNLGKAPCQPINYRPIAVTSHIYRLMDQVVNERLRHFLEKRELVAAYQQGFRRDRSTVDPVLCLEDGGSW